MNFEFSSAFYGFLLLLPLALMHLRNSRRRNQTVSSLNLWRFAAEGRESSIRRKLRRSLHLLLQALVIILLTASAADPSLPLYDTVSRDSVIIIIDGSASMTAERNGTERFDEARTEALRIINRRRGRETAVIIAGRDPELLSGFTGSRRELASLVKNAEAAAEEADIPKSLDLAENLSGGAESGIVLISDGCFSLPDSVTFSGADFTFIPVGDDFVGNTGITAFNARRDPDIPNRHHLFASIYNGTSVEQRRTLVLTLDGEEAGRLEVLIPPESELQRGFALDTVSGSLRLRIETVDGSAPDSFPLDDQASLSIRDARPLRLLLVSDGNYYLETLLGSMSGVELSVATALPPAVFDVIIFDKPPEGPLPQADYIFWGAAPDNFPVEPLPGSGRGWVDFPAVTRWDSAHPVMDGIDPRTFTVYRAAAGRAVPGGHAVPLLEAEVPLIYAYDDGTAKAVYLSFPLAASNLMLRTAFPLLAGNILEWFAPGPGASTYDYSPDGAVNLLSLNESDLTRKFSGVAEGSASEGELRSADAGRLRLWPSLLGLGCVLLVFERILARRGNRGAGRRGRAELLLTAASVLLLIIAGFNPFLPLGGRQISVSYLLDTSYSVSPELRNAGLSWIKAAAEAGGNVSSSLITFGAEAQLSSAPAAGVNTKIEVLPPGGATDIEQAFRRALSVLPDDLERRIVLLSDGNETDGDLLGLLSSIDEPGLSLYTVPLEGGNAGNELLISSLTGPDSVRLSEQMPLTVEVESHEPAAAELVLYVDGEYYGEDELDVRAGMNQFVYNLGFSEPGFHSLEAVIYSEADFRRENNRGRKVVFTGGRSPLLYIYGSRPSEYFLSMMEAQGWETDVRAVAAFPQALSELFSYDAVILDNVSAYALTFTQMDVLKKAVSAGLGVLVSGGDTSFGLGGYYSTPLESILPVDVDITSSMDLPETAILMLIDKSGTMSGATAAAEDGRTRLNIDLAKQAVLSAVEVLEPTHHAGILAFDADTEWTVPITGAGELELISRQIERLSPGGGTRFYPALEEAYRVLSVHPAAVKHILLLSDGHAEDAEYEKLVTDIRRDGITLSTVALGAGANTGLMQDLAVWGRGRAYRAESAGEVPAIFAEESMKASRKLTVEQTFFPQIAAAHPVLKGFGEDWVPPLGGFMLSYLKPEAELLLEGVDGHPLLAVKQFGLGRTAAFTSAFDSTWTEDWTGWDGYAGLFSGLVEWISRGSPDEGISVRIRKTSDRAFVTADAHIPGQGYIDNLTLAAQVITPELDESRVVLKQSGPGRYSGSFPLDIEGDYFVTLLTGDEEFFSRAGISGPVAATPRSSTSILSLQYPDEYRRIVPSISFLRNAAELTGGSILPLHTPPSPEFYEPDPELPSAPLPLKSWLLLAALTLFFAALLLRLKPFGFSSGLDYDELAGKLEEERRRRNDRSHSADFWFGR